MYIDMIDERMGVWAAGGVLRMNDFLAYEFRGFVLYRGTKTIVIIQTDATCQFTEYEKSFNFCGRCEVMKHKKLTIEFDFYSFNYRTDRRAVVL